MGERERAHLVVVLDLQVGGGVVEDHGDVVRVARLERGRVGDLPDGVLHRVERVRADEPLRGVGGVRVVLLRHEAERKLAADRVRGHLIVVAPRVIAHERHARHGPVRSQQPHDLVRSHHLVGVRERPLQLHPFHVALALADAHEVIGAACWHAISCYIRRPISD